MTACMTYHLTKTLRTWGQKSLATRLNDVGRKLLSADGMDRNAGSAELPQGLPEEGNNDDGDGGKNLSNIRLCCFRRLKLSLVISAIC